MPKDANGNEIVTEPGDTPDNGTSSTSEPTSQVVETDSAGTDDDFDYKSFDYLDTPPAQSEGVQDSPPAVTPPVTPPEPKAPESQVGQQPPVVTPAQVPPQQAAQPPVAPTPAPAAPAQETQPPQAAQPAGAQNPQPQADGPDPFANLDRTIQAAKEQTIQAVAAQAYQLSPQELEAVATEPEKVLPVLMAKVHVNAVQGVLRHVSQQMPKMVGAIMQAEKVNRDREESFFKAWPQLDREKHMGAIMQAGQVFRQMNPNATHEDFIKHVGAHVVLANGLQNVQPPVAQRPVAQPRPAPVPPPFQPAGVGGMSAPAAPQATNIWDEFTRVYQEEVS